MDELRISAPASGPAVASEIADAAAIAAKQDPRDTIDVWQYLAENINEFAVAKSIVDHFEACPKGLHDSDVDTLGLFLRAKVTIKREQIAYAQALQAVEKARTQSRGLHGVLRSASGFITELRAALRARADAVLLVMGMALWICRR